VERLAQALHLHVHLADAAEVIGERGVADVVVAGVGEHDEVRGHLRPVLLEEAAQVPRADLLLALDDELHVERERPRRPQVGADGGHVGHDPALVVGGAPAVEPAAALGGLEGGREPVLRAAGRHHVVVPVEEHAGRVRPMQPLPVHVGVHAGDLQHLDVLHARVAERLRHRLRGAAHLLRGKAGGGDAGDAAEVHQGLPPVAEPRVQVAQRVPHDAARRHAQARFMVLSRIMALRPRYSHRPRIHVPPGGTPVPALHLSLPRPGGRLLAGPGTARSPGGRRRREYRPGRPKGPASTQAPGLWPAIVPSDRRARGGGLAG